MKDKKLIALVACLASLPLLTGCPSGGSSSSSSNNNNNSGPAADSRAARGTRDSGDERPRESRRDPRDRVCVRPGARRRTTGPDDVPDGGRGRVCDHLDRPDARPAWAGLLGESAVLRDVIPVMAAKPFPP